MRTSIIGMLFTICIVIGLVAGCQPLPPLPPMQTEAPAEQPPAESPVSAMPELGTERGAEMAQPLQAPAGCPVLDPSTGQQATGNADLLALLLASSGVCPTDVFELRDLLMAEGAQFTTAMVANRGFHNPAFGSFSFFEMVDGHLASIDKTLAAGEFFFGHFTAPDGSELIADQDPRRGSLMVELIAWDPEKGAFNFYELRGTGAEGLWVYNGDSFDILEDIALLHRQPDPGAPQFGENLRCSGCHMAGGPIMKELAAPYNDWFTVDRGLDFGGRTPDAGLAAIVGDDLGNLADAEVFAEGVRHGLGKLQTSEALQTHKDTLSLQERLRPLFCTVEMNLETDMAPLDDDADTIQIPAAFFVDPRLAQGAVTVDKAHYQAALEAHDARFPEIDRRDGDHAWETPVKATSDIMAVQTLVDQGVTDEEFISDVLAVDMTNPALSRDRCGLLRLLPDVDAAAGDAWQETFAAALEAASDEDPAAALLLDFITDPEKNAQFHRDQAKQLLATCQERLQDEESVAALYGLLAQKRLEVFASEISMSPGGQILEPGFRVIFPDVSPQPAPWSSVLTAACEVTATNGQ